MPVCFVCAYASAPCARAELVGQIRTLSPELQGATLELVPVDGASAELVLRPPWQRLVGDLERHGFAAIGAERQVTLAAYHLTADPRAPNRWVAGPESLVVLEPEWLEDVTSLTRTQYCEREYLIRKFQPDAASEAILRGTLAHAIFRQIVATPDDNSLLQEALDQGLRGSALQMAALQVDPVTARTDALPVLRNLVRWVRQRAPAGASHSETFLLAHRLGMRGRIDAAWTVDGRIDTVAELKTGKTWNGRARVEHELQVGAYGLMLAERGQADLRQERLLLLYGTNEDENGSPDLERQVPFRARTFANLVHFRNRLVLIDLTGRATYQGPSRCRPCRLKLDCHRLTELLEEPRCANGCVMAERCPGQSQFSPAERELFARWSALLEREWRAINDATARLWRTHPSSRCADGSAAEVLESSPRAPLSDGSQPYRLHLGNDCEARLGDRLLLSDAAGPAAGQVAQVEVRGVGDRTLEVLANEPLRFAPRWLDQYGSDRLFLRNYAGLYGWLAEPTDRRALLTELRPPRFATSGPPARDDLPDNRRLNPLQVEALTLALRAEDYLLIQGPPGSGKTEVIAALARQLTDDGRRVLLLAGTNRALDRLLSACARLGLEERLVRLGSRAEPGSAGERRLLTRLAGLSREEGESEAPLEEVVARIAELMEAPILAATTSTIGGGVYATLRGRFDTVILDEASQVTLPAALGVVGFARRFILVGDHRQLPPVVQSEPPEQGPGLSESLFEHLARARETDGQPGLVRLEEQYRMNTEICAFPSQTWYDGHLHSAPSVATARLRLAVSPGLPPTLTDILDPARPVLFVDLSAAPGGAPRTNPREAELARLLLEAARRGELPARDLAVIAPFRAQVAAIRLELKRSDDPELVALADELVDTVDRFQGSERALVIYSFSSFGLELHPLMLDDRRLNVALTRARHKLILLGDLRTLRVHPRFAALESFCRGLYPDGAGVIT
jgi:DNA replication ATP-dependent helicase Dna2